MFFVNVVEMILPAALAGLLIVIGIQLVKLGVRQSGTTHRRTVDSTFVSAAVRCSSTSSKEEVIGLALAIGFAAWRIIRVSIDAEELRAPNGTRACWHVTISGSCSFLALPRLSAALASVPAGADVLIDLNVDYLDHAAMETLEDWIRQHRSGADHRDHRDRHGAN